jgi:hypothetical protein
VLDLPEPEDSFDERLIADIREYGWHCVLVDDAHHPEHAAENAALGPHPVYDATFAYSVGLWLTRHHAELILVGRWQHAHAMIASAVSLIEDGVRFHIGDVTDQILEGHEVGFRGVSADQREELLTYASWTNRRRPFEALQLVLPDVTGLWPWDPGYAGFPQPLLD